jgi:RimJ/RimL family protein N-acetyltransferase
MALPGIQLHWPVTEPRTIVLADGSRAVVRTLAGGEAAVVQEVFDGMSEASRRQRFAGAKPSLSVWDLELLSRIDHEDHEAFVALDAETGVAVGEAHLVRDRDDRQVGEVAFAVADAWQGRRLGTYLAEVVARRARELGMNRVRATMLADNSRSRALLRRMGSLVHRRYEAGGLELEVALD